MNRITLLAVVLATSACVKQGGRGSPVRPTGGVYRTTAMGSAVGGGKVKGGGGSRGELLKAGQITAIVSYAMTVGIGQFTSAVLFSDFDRMIGGDDTVSKLWFPVVGAWAGLIHNETTVRTNCEAATVDNVSAGSCDLVGVASAGIAIGALAQTAGVVLIVLGLLEDAKDKGGGGAPPRVVITPHGSAHTAGLTVGGRF